MNYIKNEEDNRLTETAEMGEKIKAGCNKCGRTITTTIDEYRCGMCSNRIIKPVIVGSEEFRKYEPIIVLEREGDDGEEEADTEA